MAPRLLRLSGCRLLREGRLVEEDLWIRRGAIVDPEPVFFEEKTRADAVIECGGAIVAPGYVDLQINGGYGVDFSYDTSSVEAGVAKVAGELLAHGVTSFYPTVVTSPTDTYRTVLPRIGKRPGGRHGATVLGVHVEGPFISAEKKGAHPAHCIRALTEGMRTLADIYGTLDAVGIVTLAPEIENAYAVIRQLTDAGVTVSLGHSMADLAEGEEAVRNGATFITHLFNAMLPFHHRDPGLVGLLASNNIPKDKKVFFGIIADGAHTHPAALRIAYKTHPDGLVLVSDAISALGLSEGRHHIGQLDVEVKGGRAYVAGTNTLCGSTAALDNCVKIFKKSTGCSIEYALEAASLHPAQTVGIAPKKGTLDFGADADFVILDDELTVLSTWIAGECVYEKKTK